MVMKAARIIRPLEIQQLDLPKPRGSQVLVNLYFEAYNNKAIKKRGQV